MESCVQHVEGAPPCAEPFCERDEHAQGTAHAYTAVIPLFSNNVVAVLWWTR